jgi:hypothetical protein
MKQNSWRISKSILIKWILTARKSLLTQSRLKIPMVSETLAAESVNHLPLMTLFAGLSPNNDIFSYFRTETEEFLEQNFICSILNQVESRFFECCNLRLAKSFFCWDDRFDIICLLKNRFCDRVNASVEFITQWLPSATSWIRILNNLGHSTTS